MSNNSIVVDFSWEVRNKKKENEQDTSLIENFLDHQLECIKR